MQLSNQISKHLIDIGLDISKFSKFKEVERNCIDFETGELLNEQYIDNKLLIKYYFELRKRGVFLKHFKKTGKTQIRNSIYSRHKLCAVANYLKYKRLVKIWKKYLETNFEKLKGDFLPLHVVLTVPHSEGVWNGKTFYANDLIEKFKYLRTKTKCKKYFGGGEYNCENKQSDNGNGIHSHLHILCFMSNEYSVNEAREEIRNEWQRLTGGYIIHCESLYYKEKVMHQYASNLQEVHKSTRYQKVYINESSSLQDWDRGMMETLKYHFKSDDYTQKELIGEKYKTKTVNKIPQYDIGLIKTILANTQDLNLYGRFGFCYNDKSLNLNHKKDDAPQPREGHTIEEKPQPQGEEVSMGKIENGEAYSISPETFEKVEDTAYTLLYCTRPESLFYHSKYRKDLAYAPKMLKDIKREKYIYEINSILSTSQQIKLISLGNYFELFTLESYQKYQKEEKLCTMTKQ
jgi:hypothetical protein